MDFSALIEKQACLREYFTEFPKKLKQLADKGKVIKFCENGIEFNLDELSDYLASKESVFQVKTISDFFETLQILQFSKTLKHKRSYVFVNPNFAENKEISDEFYKQAIDITNINELKNTKHMSPMHNFNLLNRLISSHNCSKIKLTKLQYKRMQLKFLLQRLAGPKTEEDVVGHDIDEPEYTKNNEIAGYYGDVELNDLKKVFDKYFPIYQENSNLSDNIENEMIINQNDVDENQVNDVEMEYVPETVQEEVPLIPEIPVIKPIEEVQQAEKLPLPEVIDDENKENQPPMKKRRKYQSRASKITKRETNDALVNLQREFEAFSGN